MMNCCIIEKKKNLPLEEKRARGANCIALDKLTSNFFAWQFDEITIVSPEEEFAVRVFFILKNSFQK